jgi:hypothetical protein
MNVLLRLSPTILALALAMVLPNPNGSVAPGSLPSVTMNVASAAPRQVEATTERAVARDYASAWQAMAEALNQNRSSLLSANFVGAANDTLAATIDEQRKSGLRQHIIDQGHTVDAVFYSPEGSAIELHDTARLQLQLLDGSKVVSSQDATVHYVALLTAAENSWKVRVLEAVPGS